MTSHRKLGLLALSVALTSFAAIASAVLASMEPMLIDAVSAPRHRLLVWSAGAGFVLLAGLSLVFARSAQRLPRGTEGRLRFVLLGYAALLVGVGAALALGLLRLVGAKLPAGTPMSLEDAFWLLPATYRALLIGVATLLSGSAVVTLIAGLTSWFMLASKIRRVMFAFVDVLLLGACAWLSYRYQFSPTELTAEAVLGATLRLVVTLLFGARIGVRLLPLLLDGIEQLDFRSLVAARHLRAKKSGFLAAISFLSILAVSVSSCALTTTLSVMGGFRYDLKRKILGNNAHIVVDRPEGEIAHYDTLAKMVRGVSGVRGVSPYLSGEVMISSASNLAGAVLRGIDVDHVGEVSELPLNMRVGSLAYLKDPTQLKSAPASQFGSSFGLPKTTRLDDESDAPPAKASRLTAEVKKALGDDDREETAKSAPVGSTLPGIVVGQELARSLRLYLGDEVNVVTPLGDLGPTGPMPKSRPFRVAGIFYSGMYEYDMKFAYVTLASAQRFLSASGTASGIEITVREPDRAQEVALNIAQVTRGRAKEIVGAAPGKPDTGLRVRAWQELNKNLFGALALEKLAMFIALGIAILVASFCIVGTLTLMVQEKGREVAVLKAMGAGDRMIVSIFVLEGTLIGVLGSTLGLALGYAVCFAAEHFGVRLNPEVFYMDKLPVHIDPTEFLTVGIAAIVVSLLVTIYPAKVASRLRPVDALRYE
ncbi:MAG: Lipoprotein releasing system transrane protein LolC [Myxococcaceae bacterium]|nr:Lipoprotein releasing system transrane protein LolC [Myxococcaceae bacterium]